MRAVRFFLTLIIASSGFIACDTSNTMDAPVKNYFLKYFGNDGDQEGVDLVIDSQGFFYLLGNTSSQISLNGSRNVNGQQLYLVKADAQGNMVWERSFGGPLKEEARDIEFTSDGRLIIVGNSEAAVGDTDVFLLTVDTDGNKLDSAVYGFNNYAEDVRTVTEISGEFFVAGSTTNLALKPNPPSGAPPATDIYDALQLRFFNTLDPDTLIWRRANGTDQTDVSIKISPAIPTPGGPSYYVFGYSNKPNLGDSNDDFNFWYYGIGPTGEPGSADWTIGSPVDNEKLSSVAITPIQSGDGFILTGITTGTSGASDIYISKLRKSLTFSAQDLQFSKPLSASLDQLSPGFERVAVYPSAFSGFILLANERTQGNSNFYLTKISNDGSLVWGPPFLIFGGPTHDDFVGSVNELPDGRVILFGTMEVGDEGQKKMTLIKVNPNGKFEE